MNEVVVRFPKPIAVFLLLAGPPIFLGMAGVLVWILALMPKVAHKIDPVTVAIGYLIFPPLIVLTILFLWFGIKHWETLFTEFRVSATGLEIRNKRYGVLQLRWSEVEARYGKLMKTLTIQSPRLQRPIAIMNNNSQRLTEEFQSALALARSNTPNRWSEKWLLSPTRRYTGRSSPCARPARERQRWAAWIYLGEVNSEPSAPSLEFLRFPAQPFRSG